MLPAPHDESPGATVAAEALRPLLEVASELALDVAPLCAEAGVALGLVTQPGARLPLAAQFDLWEAASARWPHDDLVPRAARRRAPGDYGVLGFLAMSAPTVADALEIVATHLKLWADEPRLELREGRLRLGYGRPLPDRPGLRRVSEATLAEVLQTLKAFSGHALEPLAVAFAHAPPGDPRPLEAFFGAPLHWHAADNWLELSAEQLALPLSTADARLHALLRPMAREALNARGTAESVAHRARAALGGVLSDGPPTAAAIAPPLAMSERTLRRRLADEGLGFRQLLEQTRIERARTYLANPAVPLAEVSFELGFSEPSAFHRAFKRWTGQTPATFRRAPSSPAATASTPLQHAPR